jgi:hypothetical protein
MQPTLNAGSLPGPAEQKALLIVWRPSIQSQVSMFIMVPGDQRYLHGMQVIGESYESGTSQLHKILASAIPGYERGAVQYPAFPHSLVDADTWIACIGVVKDELGHLLTLGLLREAHRHPPINRPSPSFEDWQVHPPISPSPLPKTPPTLEGAGCGTSSADAHSRSSPEAGADSRCAHPAAQSRDSARLDSAQQPVRQ